MLVSNSSTLILLAKISLLETWLSQCYGITIPEEVFSEAVLGREEFDARLIKKLVEENKIKVEHAEREITRKAMIEFRLDLGEAAAFALCNPKKYQAIMTDDGELIKLCRLEKIEFINALSIVVGLYQKKIIEKETALEKLDRLKIIGRYSKEIFSYFRSKVEGEK